MKRTGKPLGSPAGPTPSRSARLWLGVRSLETEGPQPAPRHPRVLGCGLGFGVLKWLNCWLMEVKKGRVGEGGEDIRNHQF